MFGKGKEIVKFGGKSGRSGRDSFPQEPLESLTEWLKNRVVWLDPISLYPHDGNPVVAMMVRIEEACSRYGARSPAGGPDYERTLQLSQTFSAIGLGGEKTHAKAVGLDNYAVDVRQTEQARIAFPKLIKQAMQEISIAFNKMRIIPNPVFCLVLLDYDIHFRTQQHFIDVVEHYLPDEIEVFVVGDGDLPTLRVDRNHSKFHVFTPEEFDNFQKSLGESGTKGWL